MERYEGLGDALDLALAVEQLEQGFAERHEQAAGGLGAGLVGGRYGYGHVDILFVYCALPKRY